MGIQMNIKNAEAYKIASELAEKSGVGLTQAVLDALRARKWDLEKEDRVKRALEIARDMRARMSPETLALDIDDFLYDEYGLPK